MMLSSGVNYGVKASLPNFFGICFGFPLMVLLVGLGFGVVFERFPLLHIWIKITGVLYLLWLAWKIGSSTPCSIEGSDAKPFSFYKPPYFNGSMQKPGLWLLVLWQLLRQSPATPGGM